MARRSLTASITSTAATRISRKSCVAWGHRSNGLARSCPSDEGRAQLSSSVVPYRKTNTSPSASFVRRLGGIELDWRRSQELRHDTLLSYSAPSPCFQSTSKTRIGFIQRLRQYPALARHGHEVCVADPARKDMHVDVAGNPGPGCAAYVHADVDAIR